MANVLPQAVEASAPYDQTARTALLIAEDGDLGLAAADALRLAGYQPREGLGFADAARDLGVYDGIDLILIEAAGVSDALFDAVMARADAISRERSLALVISVARDQIDTAAQFLGPRTQILCMPSDVERLAALAQDRWNAGARLNDVTRDAESVRLQRLNEEVARIADTLARLTRGEEGERRAGVRDPGSGYRGPETSPPVEISAREVRAVIRSRRMRSQFFAGELFADPAWDMLLDLFASQLERRQVSVSSLCIAAAVPPTTALRWITTMHEAGLFERQADPSDRRRAYIALSAKGLEGMRSYASAVKRAGLQLA